MLCLDVKENVMQYFHVFNRRLVTKPETVPKWSQMYAGSNIGGRKVHGLVISSTVAVYNESSNATSLLGVVGTDVPIDSLMSTFTKPYQMGPNAYAFLITKTGYVTIHPDLKVKYKGKNRKNYRSMSIVDLENFRDKR